MFTSGNMEGESIMLNNLSTHNTAYIEARFCAYPSIGGINTDMESGSIIEFIEKEGKWFNYIRGEAGAINTDKLNFQGLGIVLDTEE